MRRAHWTFLLFAAPLVLAGCGRSTLVVDLDTAHLRWKCGLEHRGLRSE